MYPHRHTLAHTDINIHIHRTHPNTPFCKHTHSHTPSPSGHVVIHKLAHRHPRLLWSLAPSHTRTHSNVDTHTHALNGHTLAGTHPNALHTDLHTIVTVPSDTEIHTNSHRRTLEPSRIHLHTHLLALNCSRTHTSTSPRPCILHLLLPELNTGHVPICSNRYWLMTVLSMNLYLLLFMLINTSSHHSRSYPLMSLWPTGMRGPWDRACPLAGPWLCSPVSSAHPAQNWCPVGTGAKKCQQSRDLVLPPVTLEAPKLPYRGVRHLWVGDEAAFPDPPSFSFTSDIMEEASGETVAWGRGRGPGGSVSVLVLLGMSQHMGQMSPSSALQTPALHTRVEAS